MALSDQERDRIREEEWIRLQARADFYKTNPGAAPGWGPDSGPGWGPWWGRYRHPWYPVALAIILAFVLLNNIVRYVRWDHILP